MVKSGGVWAAALALTVGLGGCGSGETVGQIFGIERKGPDEMAIIKRPPLVVPPDYNLRPPRPGETRSNPKQVAEDARRTLTGAEPTEPVVDEAVDAAALPNVKDSEPAEINGEAAAPAPSASEQARTVLTGQEGDWQKHHKSPPLLPKEEVAAVAVPEEKPAPSAGQTALLDRTNRVEHNLEALSESRAENRVDHSLLNRLITWQPEAEGDTSPDGIVQIVRREQTPIDQPTASE
jgi:hypothetical protein